MAIELNRQYTSKSGNRGTYFRDPDGHLMEILTAIGGEPS
jgi:catechol 2,3-dioxygenase-like lactoylglutathione lyase family enzyme